MSARRDWLPWDRFRSVAGIFKPSAGGGGGLP
jgi:hypothetical protein